MTMKRTHPHFIAIGAPHAGLTTVMRLLVTHPNVDGTIPSLHFFSTDAFTKKGPAWYEAQFSKGEHHMITGECTPQYLSRPDIVPHIVRHFPDTKLVVMVRHPLRRAIAHFEQWRQSPKQQHRKISFTEFLNHVPEAQSLGLYGQQLEVYFSYYSPLQIHVMTYEEFAEAPLQQMQELYRFLGIHDDFIATALRQFAPPPDEPRHPSLIYRAKKAVRQFYKKIFKKAPLPITPPEYALSTYISAANQKLLTDFYAADAARLSRLMHRDMGLFWSLVDNKTDLA